MSDGWLATRIARIPLITTTTLFFGANLVIFSFVGQAGAREGGVFYTRVGDVLQALLVFVGTTIGLTVAGFAWVNVVLTGVWIMVARQIAKEHRRKTG